MQGLTWTKLHVVLRSHIPVEIQGRVYSVRNTLQFFTIPIGYFLGGLFVDNVFEPYMMTQSAGTLPAILFGTGKGGGAAMLFFILGFVGVATCLIFRKNKHIWELERQ